MIFISRRKWSHPYHIDPTSYNVGFEIINMSPDDMLIFQRMFEKYGSQNAAQKKGSSDDFMWR